MGFPRVHFFPLSHGKAAKFGKTYEFKWFFKQAKINLSTLYLYYTINCYKSQYFLVLIKDTSGHFAA